MAMDPRFTNERRVKKMVALTLDASALEQLDELSREHEDNRSLTVRFLIREAFRKLKRQVNTTK